MLCKDLLRALLLGPEEVSGKLNEAIEVTALGRFQRMSGTIRPGACLYAAVEILVLKELELGPVEWSILADAVSIGSSVFPGVPETFVFDGLVDLVQNLLHRHVVGNLNL